MLLHQIGCCTVTHKMYGWKDDRHKKPCLSSLTQKFIHYYTFQEDIGRKKECMKAESTTLAGQRESTWHEKKENRDRPWIFFLGFGCNSNVVVSWFHLHRFTSCMRQLFGAHPKMRTATSGCLHITISNL